ncbi:MAG: TauD/TfdA family dioxygenase [Acidimicrobiales bacterium]
MKHKSPLTPDFYEYPWVSLDSAELGDGFVLLGWPDGMTLEANCLWLRESAVGEGATDPVTREGTVDLSLTPPNLRTIYTRVSEDGALEVEWSDGFRGTLHPGWLRHVAAGLHEPSAFIPAHEAWTSSTFDEPPTFSAEELLSDGCSLLPWMRALVRFGIARIENLSTSEETVLSVTSQIGSQRDTNFGLDWPVKAEISSNDENSTANTTLRLGNHTDLPTREIPPGFQFLHCIENSVAGGRSTMADGEAIAEHLRASEPDVFEALSSLSWVWFNRSRDHDHRWSGPILDYGAKSSPLTIRAFYPLRAFPDMDQKEVPRAYRAARRFHELAGDARFQISYPFKPGDLVGFDNRRILHGREAFDEGAGRRYLRGTYVDHDEVHSRVRVLERRNQAERQQARDTR